uniref:Uncharacterized protein n=1 Tax=Romanomermis culicivorax TaxID=13658 RepID=A0A915IMY0_ROMCU
MQQRRTLCTANGGNLLSNVDGLKVEVVVVIVAACMINNRTDRYNMGLIMGIGTLVPNAGVGFAQFRVLRPLLAIKSRLLCKKWRLECGLCMPQFSC